MRDVLHERERQRRVEGFTAARDDQYKTGELRRAAVSYVLNTLNSPKAFDWWPWDLAWLKPHGTRRDLVKAGALILAEIERLDRVRMDQESRGDG
ncbi:hypothetical protein HLH44_03815 [Gluconacetobacter sp. 1c LMG 22058]|uniref:Phage protein n=1 Tax=Gluconacetobacter dulcium TaxID=2729096 RepID=A0A7W4PHL7_9PROT|nr:hypothetical protein [Gluconacetobacter dulcium]